MEVELDDREDARDARDAPKPASGMSVAGRTPRWCWTLLALAAVVPRASQFATAALGSAALAPAVPAPAALATAAAGIAATGLLFLAGRAAGGWAVGLLAAALYSTDAALVAREVASSFDAALLLGSAFALCLGGFASARWATARGGRALLLVAGALAAAAPLLIAGERSGEGAIPIGLGEALYQGSNPEARGIGAAPPALFEAMRSPLAAAPVSARALYREVASADLGRAVSDGEADRLWSARASAFARRRPADWLRLEARKALLFLAGSDAPPAERARPSSRSRRARFPAPLTTRLLVPLGLFGVLVAAARSARVPFALGLLAGSLAAALAVSVGGRTAVPAAAPLALLGAAGLAWAARAARRRRPTALLLPAVAIPVALFARVDSAFVRGYRADAEAARRAESLLAEARDEYRAERFPEYRKRAIAAAYLSPDLVLVLPMIGEDAVGRSVTRAEPAILSAIRTGRAEEAILVGRYYVAAGESRGAYERLRGQDRHPWFGPEAAVLRARAALRIGHAPEALALLDAERSLPAEGAALRAAILSRMGDGRAGAARTEIDALFGPTAAAYFCGRAFLELGDPAAARAELDDVVRRLPGFARARLERAACYAALGDDRAAAAESDSALARDPDAHLASLQISAALARLAQASPEDRPARARLGAALLREGDFRESARVLGQLLMEDPANDAARASLARALLAMGRAAEARSIGAALADRR